MTTDNDNISIRTTVGMEKYESLRHREFSHTCVYDVNLLERVGLDKELHTILWTISWGKLYDERRMDDFAHMQTEMQASIDSHTNMMHDLFGHFEVNPDA
jgi:hypothetical protein